MQLKQIAVASVLFSAAISTGFCASYRPGTYQASAQGMGGPVEISVTFSENAITGISIGKNHETPGVGTTALDRLPGEIVRTQSLGIDGVSGASKSTGAVFAAVEDCIRQAGGDPAAARSAPFEKKASTAEKELSADLVIVGGGGAGQVAAIRASELGKKVILLEKMEFTGGAAAINGGTVVVQGSRLQKDLGVTNDSPELMRQDYLRNGHNLNDREKLDLYVNNVGSTIDWLLTRGLEIDTASGFTNEAEHSAPRCIRWVGGAPANMLRMIDSVKRGGAEVYTSTRAQELIIEDGRVTGVRALAGDGTRYTVRGRAVLLATGGFGYAKDMLQGDLKQALYYGPVSSTGDGHRMAQKVNARLQLMEHGKLYPNGVEVAPGIAKSTIWANKNAFEKESGILVDRSGRRVIDEVASNNAIKAVELKQPDSMLFILMDQKSFDSFKKGLSIGGITGEEVDAWVAADGKGTPKFVKAATIEEAAAKIGIDGPALAAEARKYNGFVTAGKDTDFNRRTKFMNRTISEAGPYYICEQQPRFATTMGGVVTDDSFNVLDQDGRPIAGLYAAGELVGGSMGNDSPPGGNMGWAVTSGKLAAEGAAASMK